ncbi:cAMP-regulated phosphoprotein 21-like, partial [Sycon ciliatum]|uniref:cAMP-regulated phosphoprotein 21-like n=1 Tax=Sycon ciliatum TaxID=27933 RepID=UPI0031F6D64C
MNVDDLRLLSTQLGNYAISGALHYIACVRGKRYHAIKAQAMGYQAILQSCEDANSSEVCHTDRFKMTGHDFSFLTVKPTEQTVSSKPAMSMSKVRVLRSEDSTGQVSPSGRTSISYEPRPSPEAVSAQPAAATSSPRSSLDDSAKIKQSSPTGNASVSVFPPLPMTDADNTSLYLRQFLIVSLNQAKDRWFLLQTEQSILGHLTSKQHMAPLKISTATSYHRMLVHRVAAFFRMDYLTNHLESGVILQKTAKTRLPGERFKELIQMKSGSGEGDDSTASAAPTVGISPRVILKRQDAPNASIGAGSGSSSPTANQSNQNGDKRRLKTIKEREAEYEEHRKRIFSQHPAISTAGESSTGSTAVTTSSGCRATSSANFAARAPNTVVPASASTSAPRNNSDQVVDALVDMDYDRSLPLTSSDTSLAGVLGVVASGSANCGKPPGMRSQGLGEALPVASSVAISGLPGSSDACRPSFASLVERNKQTPRCPNVIRRRPNGSQTIRCQTSDVDQPDDTPPDVTIDPLLDFRYVSENNTNAIPIGRMGTILILDGAMVKFPPGAVNEETTISPPQHLVFEERLRIAKGAHVTLHCLMGLQPHGMHFREPVEVEIDVPGLTWRNHSYVNFALF